MRARSIVFMVLVAGAIVLPWGGCGGAKSCKDLCAGREACPDILPGEKSCELQCKDLELLLKQSGCETEQADFDSCLSELPDICDTSTCSTEANARYACLHTYCSAHADVSGCAPYAT